MRLTTTLLMLLFVFTINAQSTSSIRSDVNPEYDSYRIGSYGELLFQQMDYGPNRYAHENGSPSDNRSIIDLPRLVLEFNYKLRKDIEFVTEIEFEHGGTGSALELEYEEMGEYEMEMEKAGEVVLEQFFIKKSFSRAFNVKVGHMLVPIGITNARHLPTQFFTTVRAEGEMSMLPLTWHETGISVLGDYRRWSYELQLINGLDANGFSSANWIVNGKQGIFETIKITDPAVVLRIENRTIKNLNVGAAIYYGNSTGNTAKPEKMEHILGTVSVFNFDVEYKNKKAVIRGNFVYGNISDSEEISKINRSISKNIQYSRTPVAQNAMTYAIEAGYNVFGGNPNGEKLIPFVRYDYYNTMEQTSGSVFKDARYKREVFTIGINYFLMENLCLKADYSSRKFDNLNSEHTFGLGLVFNHWFIKK
ncbi:MAG: hypothetical protein JKY08_05325 [Flavobacteriaceae bacterium]|nr:hypothetical protein [Flavobacteriaceae bacterium]